MLDGNESNPRVKLFDTFGAGLQALKTGDVDLILTDSTAGKAIVAQYPKTFKIIGQPLGSEDFGFIFPKCSKLEASVNAAIKALKADGTFDKLTQKWFVDYKMEQVRRRPCAVPPCRGHLDHAPTPPKSRTGKDFPW